MALAAGSSPSTRKSGCNKTLVRYAPQAAYVEMQTGRSIGQRITDELDWIVVESFPLDQEIQPRSTNCSYEASWFSRTSQGRRLSPGSPSSTTAPNREPDRTPLRRIATAQLAVVCHIAFEETGKSYSDLESVTRDARFADNEVIETRWAPRAASPSGDSTAKMPWEHGNRRFAAKWEPRRSRAGYSCRRKRGRCAKWDSCTGGLQVEKHRNHVEAGSETARSPQPSR